MKILSSLIIILSLLSTAPVFALIELRGAYQLNNTSGVKDNNDNVPNMKTPAGLSADVVAVFLGFVGGLRYERLTERKTAGNFDYDANFTRTSLVAGYRILDTGWYLGPIATLGLSSKLDYVMNNGSRIAMKSANKSNYSVGVEGGFQALGYLVGAEIGYLSAKLGDMENKATGGAYTSNGQVVTADMSGVYTRIVAGFTF